MIEEKFYNFYESLTSVQISLLLVLLLFSFLNWIYPFLYIKYPVVRDIKFMERFCRFMMRHGLFYWRRLPEYNQELFRFEPELLEEHLLTPSNVEFEDLYEIPSLELIDRVAARAKETVGVEEFVNSFEDVKGRKRLIFVEGKAGYGKSTFLKFIGHKFINDNTKSYYPFYLKARQLEVFCLKWESVLRSDKRFLIESGSIFPVMIRSCYHAKNSRVSMCEIEKASRQKSVLLIDGCDEIKDRKNIGLIVELVQKIRNEKPNLVVVMSGRPESSPFKIKHDNSYRLSYRLAEMNKDKVKSIIQKSFNNIYSYEDRLKECPDFIDRVMKNQALFDMARIPLLLTLMISLRKENEKLPEKRDLLVGKFIDWSIFRRLSLGEETIKNAFKDILSRVAYDLSRGEYSNEKLRVIIEDATACVQMESFESEASIKRFLKATGILVHDVNEFEFIHPSIQGYLSALYMYRLWKKAKTPEVLIKEISQNENTDIIFFFCCFLNDATPLFDEFVKLKNFDVCVELLIWREMGSRINIKPDRLIKFKDVLKLRRHRDAYARAQILATLSRIKSGGHVTPAALTVEEYEYIAGPLSPMNVCDGKVVGLNYVAVWNFFGQLNEEFSDGKGEFVPLLKVDLPGKIKMDSVVSDGGELLIANFSIDDMTRIKKKLLAEVRIRMEAVLFKISSKIRIADINVFSELLFEDIVDAFYPEILLNETVRIEKMHSHMRYDRLRALLIAGDLAVYTRTLSEIDLYELVTNNGRGIDTLKLYEEILRKIYEGGKISTKKYELVMENLLRSVFSNLLYGDYRRQYAEAKIRFIKIMVYMLAQQERLSLWGRMRIQYLVDSDYVLTVEPDKKLELQLLQQEVLLEDG